MDWRLTLNSTQSWAWGVAALVATALVLFLWLRRYEAKLIPRRVSLALLILRTLTLLLLLLTLMQPVLTRVHKADQKHRLIIGLDVSESMETIDSHASPPEMLRWAQALGMLGNTNTAELFKQWVSAYEAGEEPDWTQGSKETNIDGNDLEIAELRQQHIAGVYAEFAAMSRLEFIQRLLTAKPVDLLKELSHGQDVDLRLFSTNNLSVTANDLNSQIIEHREQLQPSETDATGLISDAVSGDASETVSGIVLFSDGRQTVDADTASEASRLGGLGIPVYCVPIGSQRSPRDLSVASVRVPQTVFLGDTASVRATITSVGYAGEQVTVSLKEGTETIDQRTVTVGADYFETQFDVPSKAVGNFEYTVEIAPQQGELRDDNNTRSIDVAVVDNKSRVMLVDGDARWEFRYLNSALTRDSRVDLSTVVFQQPTLSLLNHTFLDSTLPSSEDFRQALAKTDILITGDVAPERITEATWQAIDEAVSDDGMTLMIIPGSRHMPHEYSSEILRRLLPIDKSKQRLAEDYRPTVPGKPTSEFRLAPTPEANALTLFRFSDVGGADAADLNSLQGHPSAYTGKAKQGASVWANLKLQHVELDELPAVVHQYYGFGQVVWMGIDSTWRWRFRAGDRYHHRFWGQIVRWAARNKSAAGNDQVRMTLSDIVIDESESVDVSVRWDPKLLPKLEGATAKITVSPADGATNDSPRQTFPLTPLPSSPERFTATLESLKPGAHIVELSIEDSALQIAQSVFADLLVRRKLSNELSNISCNRDFLQQVATLSGGRLLEPWELSELPELVRPKQATIDALEERTLWDHWGVMLAFFVLLTAEWILRKINGLP